MDESEPSTEPSTECPVTPVRKKRRVEDLDKFTPPCPRRYRSGKDDVRRLMRMLWYALELAELYSSDEELGQ